MKVGVRDKTGCNTIIGGVLLVQFIDHKVVPGAGLEPAHPMDNRF